MAVRWAARVVGVVVVAEADLVETVVPAAQRTAAVPVLTAPPVRLLRQTLEPVVGVAEEAATAPLEAQAATAVTAEAVT